MAEPYKLEGVPPAYAEFTRLRNQCLVRLVLNGLYATTKFWQDDGLPLGTSPYSVGPGLGEFLGDLAQNWQGWQGVKSWSDFENTLSIHAEHDGSGHVTLTFEMRSSDYDSDYGGWRLAGPLPVEAGTLERLAETARRLDAS